MVRGSNPDGGSRFSTRVLTGPGAHTSSCTMGNGYLFPEVKCPERGLDNPPPSRAEVKEGVQLYPYSPVRFPRPALGQTLPFIYFHIMFAFFVCAELVLRKYFRPTCDISGRSHRNAWSFLMYLIINNPKQYKIREWRMAKSVTFIVSVESSALRHKIYYICVRLQGRTSRHFV